MRNISKAAYFAFVNKIKFSRSNTCVVVNNEESYMYLFGNLIAKTEGDDVLINNCGYTTQTTQSRLNCFDVNIRRSKNKFIVNERFEWDRGWLNLNHLH